MSRHAPLQPRNRLWTTSTESAISAAMMLPRVQPIIPTRRKEPFDDPDWLFDFKYDGFRALCYIEQGGCRFISRNGNVLSRFEALGEHVAAVLDVDDAIIDGEVIVADETGRPQFYELLRVPRSACYVAFDILWADRHRLTLFAARRAPPTAAGHSAEGIADRFRGAIGRGEGARTVRARIRWLKIKNPDYSQKEGRGDLFNGPRQRTARTAG